MNFDVIRHGLKVDRLITWLLVTKVHRDTIHSTTVFNLCHLLITYAHSIVTIATYCWMTALLLRHTATAQRLDDRLILTNFSLWFNFYCTTLFLIVPNVLHIHSLVNCIGKGISSKKAWQQKKKKKCNASKSTASNTLRNWSELIQFKHIGGIYRFLMWFLFY